MSEDERFKILLVDDEVANLEVLNQILREEYQISVATSGTAGLKRAMSQKPDLILLDVIMPGMTGFEVLKELKNNDETRDIPVIFITGLTNEHEEEMGFLLGAVDYIFKPFRSSGVRMRVKTHLQIVKQIRTIEMLGMVDALTEIPNRRNFDLRMSQEWNRALRDRSSLSLLMLDVDHFKKYNDTYGHPQGDKVLQMLAKVMTRSINRPADFAARLGGEEFAVILPGSDLEGALVVAEKIRANVEATELSLGAPGETTSVTTSIGAAWTVPSRDGRIDELVAKADAALYEAKNSGRNRVCSMVGA